MAGRTFIPSAAVLPRWPRPGGCRHDLQIYATDAHLIDAVMGFFEGAFEAGDSILAITSEAHRQALDAQFAARGVDIAALVRAGRYTVGDAASALDAILLDGVPDAALFAAAVDPMVERALAAATGPVPHVTMFGEIAPILCAKGEFEAMIRLEQIADEYAASRPLSVLCGYSTQCLGGDASDVSLSVCARHSTILPADAKLY